MGYKQHIVLCIDYALKYSLNPLHTSANLSIKVSFVGTLALSLELHRIRKISNQQPSTRAIHQTCEVQLYPIRTSIQANKVQCSLTNGSMFYSMFFCVLIHVLHGQTSLGQSHVSILVAVFHLVLILFLFYCFPIVVQCIPNQVVFLSFY